MLSNDITFDILTWEVVRNNVFPLNPMICAEIDNIPNSNEFQVLIMRYSFGDPILDRGQWNLNIDGKLYPYYSEKIPNQIKNLMEYSWKGIPPGLVVRNSIESHIDHDSHIIPFVLHYPGKIFSSIILFEENTQSNFIAGLRSLKAGCRSLLMLTKITCSRGNHNLNTKLKINKNLYPKNYREHWSLFNEIIKLNFQECWNVELIFFSKDFFYSNNETLRFRHKLLCDIWRQTSFRREEITFDFIWSCFIKSLPLSLRHDLFVVETVKHLIKIVMKQVPGYIPAFSDVSAPISILKEIFLECYKVRYYWPIFMQLAHYDEENPIYYSLQKHTFFHDIPKNKTLKETIVELKNIHDILKEFLNYIFNDKLKIKSQETLLFKNLKKVKFDFFHPDGNKEILCDITKIAQEDPRFMATYDIRSETKKLSFPKHALFFNGCIRISPLVL